MSGPNHNQADPDNIDLPRESACGYTLIDLDGEEYPCDRPGVSWRWYQGHEHEDTLDRACTIHENPGGLRMAALVAEVRRLRDEVARKRPPEQIARNRQTASGGSAVTITTTPPQPQMIPVPVQMHRCPRCGYGR